MNIQSRIDSLKRRYQSIEARANRACARYDDCGPMDIASETLDLIQKEIDILSFNLAHPGKTLPPALQFANATLEKERAEKQAEKVAKSAFPAGSLVAFKPGTKENWGVPKELLKKNFYVIGKSKGGLKAALSLKQRLYWRVYPENLVMVKEGAFTPPSPKDYVGKTITWDSVSTHSVMTGRVVKAGYTKVSTDSGWRVPLSLILTVDGKKI